MQNGQVTEKKLSTRNFPRNLSGLIFLPSKAVNAGKLGVSPRCGTLPAACANMENDASSSISSRRIKRDANRVTIFYLLTRAGYSPHFHAAVITTQYFGKYSFPVSAYA